MIVKELEARDKWCPFAHVIVTTATQTGSVSIGSGNRMIAPPGDIAGQAQARNPDTCRCIGSRCMAWRWEDDMHVSGRCGLAR